MSIYVYSPRAGLRLRFDIGGSDTPVPGDGPWGPSGYKSLPNEKRPFEWPEEYPASDGNRFSDFAKRRVRHSPEWMADALFVVFGPRPVPRLCNAPGEHCPCLIFCGTGGQAVRLQAARERFIDLYLHTPMQGVLPSCPPRRTGMTGPPCFEGRK